MQYKRFALELLGQDVRQYHKKCSFSTVLSWKQACAGTNISTNPMVSLQGCILLRSNLSTIIFTVLLMPFLGLMGCSNSFLSKSFWNNSQDSKPSIQTNLYGRMDSYKPVAFDYKPFASLTQHSFCQEGGDFDPVISKDNNWMVFSSLRHAPNPDIYIKRITGFTATRLTSDPASEIQPCFSPAGEKVAYATNRSGNFDIWVVGVDGTNPIRLTSGISNDIHPSFSPDGKHIVYCSYGLRSSQWELWMVDTENPSVKKWIGYGLFPEWSPNPKISKIAFQRARYRGSQWFSIWTLDIVEDEAKFETEIVSNINYACITPSWSRDARFLAYCTVGKNVYEDVDPAIPDGTGEDIWIIGLDGRNAHRITGSDASDFSPTWAPDGRVFFCSDRQFIDNIWSAKPHNVDFTTQQPIQLGRHPQNVILAN